MRPALFIIPLLCACTSTGGDYRGAKSEDIAACELEGEKARTMGGYEGLVGLAGYYESYNRVFDACMRSKGYQRTASK